MMMARVILTIGLVAAGCLPACAQGQPAKAEPVQQALVQMLQEAQGREAQALVQIYTLRAQVADLQDKLAEQTLRADAAEGKGKTGSTQPKADNAEGGSH